jgi:4-aminobutyrate aminotransferase
VAADRALGHYTHEKNPVSCAAGLAVIEEIESRSLVAHARELGAFALDRLREIQGHHELVGDVRGIGLLLGVELVSDRRTRRPATEATEAVMYASLSRGLNFKTTMGNIINLSPPLTIEQTELELALSILEKAISAVERGES